jgi:hypothetical protein
MAKKVLCSIERSMVIQHLENELNSRMDDEMYDLYKFLVKTPMKFDLVQIHYNRKQMILECENELSKLTNEEVYNMYSFLDEQVLIEALF